MKMGNLFPPRRKGGPHKGDGGRPRKPLREDFPDNMIVATALWLSKGKKRVVGVPALEMLIYIFDGGDFVITPDDGIGAETVLDGVPMVMISALQNIRPKRDSGKNYPGGSRRQTPDGHTSMKRRVQFIRDKIKKHRPRLPRNPKHLAVYVLPPVLAKDQLWLGKSWFGLDCLLAGQTEHAMKAFSDAGWPLTRPEIERRLNQFLQAWRI